MASIQMIDDDDDFDWEAAVKEIDMACHNKLSSSSAPPPPIGTCNLPIMGGSCPNKIETNKPSSSRQSTLDRYIGFTALKSANQDDQDKADCHDQRVCTIRLDHEAAKTWIYPENVPVREYQLSITKTALFSNTLVCLPTGLGKTLIAAVVMYNYFRWFPEGKIVFAAPSRPLVMQQIEACHNIMGIPQEWTVDMTGQTSPAKRAGLWKTKRIFFVTPQTLEKDIQSGSCMVKQLVCLVIDEAHRASGNYSYCVVVRKLMAVSVQLRILALTATPGSNRKTVQQVIDNLQISSLEHRSESDPDVTPYVHERKIELIQVAMGKDALEVNSVLMDIIRPSFARLSAMVDLPKRDIQTLSPRDFLVSREKFKNARPHDLPPFRYGEVEGIFAALITLYHIKNLLSAHGIGPAYVMLEDKWKSLSRLSSLREGLFKVHAMMKQSLSHGALSPKFTKLIEVLVEHFKTHDPQKSRVIIFSNFRESVSEIMKALATIGTYVKATEFIGQSSGKKSKGQSQKTQQAVLEQFRAGGFNVIVATSIGEEGLDIMEVDLVICFDANVSPLRMIQRMGRTGRKNEGRVVVLACEGPELKGYLRKQANSKAIKKHMLNGGRNSFSFHSSPRMIPHVFRPEQRLVKLLIEEFVPRGKKVKDDDDIQTPKYKAKLTEAETDLIAKYFHASRENNWRPSLIAFPHFQALPSRVHEIAHSLRTRMLIDTMQCLQELPLSTHSKSFNVQDEETLEDCFRVESVEHHNSNTREDDTIRENPESDILLDASRTEEKHNWPHVGSQDPSVHSFLFGSDFISVDSLGTVLILSVPSFPLQQVSPPKSYSPRNTHFPNCLKSDSIPLKVPCGEDLETTLDVNGVSTTNDLREDKLAGDSRVVQTEISNIELFNSRENPCAVVEDTHSADESSTDSRAADLSPRLTNLLMCGVVPESPIDNGTSSKLKDNCTTPDVDMLPNAPISLVQSNNDEGAEESTPNGRNIAALCMQGEIRTPIIDLIDSSSEKGFSVSKFKGEIRSPLTNLNDNSCSKDWILTSGEKSVSAPKHRLKRLRKYGDAKSMNLSNQEEIAGHTSVSGRPCARLKHATHKHGRGDKKLFNDARAFVELEAEVSSEASGDEDVENEQDSYDGSFIDDRINPTVASTQGEAAECDMMAIYRRSLLSQTPIQRSSHFLSPDNVIPMDQMHDSGSAVGITNPSLHASHTSTNGDSSSVPLNTEGLSSTTINNGIRKRKLSFSQGGSPPIRNLEKEIFLKPEESTWQMEGENMDVFEDDEFYQGIDLDALEEEATKQLRLKSQSMNEKPNNQNQNLDLMDCPSFDLGI